VLLSVHEIKGATLFQRTAAPSPSYLGNEEARGALVKEILAFLYVR